MVDNVISPSPVFIDKVSYTVPVDECDREGLTSMVRDAIQDRDRNFQPVSSERWIQGYQHQFMFDIDSTHNSNCHVCLAPYNSSNAFVRIEFIPNEVDVRGYERIDAMHSLMLQDSSRTRLLDASITRLDVATDIPSVRPDDLLIYASGFCKTQTFYDLHGGALQTLYIGHPDSKRHSASTTNRLNSESVTIDSSLP